ncbi:MAG TPA: inorganic diphosphatase, partial [Xanthobacteraceae bacterium]|nr:inorganic diphosphatase [Xanthobacteraceae bacterium]
QMRVFIENEAGSRIKNTFDERTLARVGTAEVSRAYPYPYGFVLGTRSGDGDAVDCFVLTRTPLKSGTIAQCLAVGLLEQVEDGETDHKVLALLPGESVGLNGAVLAQLTDFVSGVFAHVPGKRMEIGRLLGREAAESFIRGCSVP